MRRDGWTSCGSTARTNAPARAGRRRTGVPARACTSPPRLSEAINLSLALDQSFSAVRSASPSTAAVGGLLQNLPRTIGLEFSSYQQQPTTAERGVRTTSPSRESDPRRRRRPVLWCHDTTSMAWRERDLMRLSSSQQRARAINAKYVHRHGHHTAPHRGHGRPIARLRRASVGRCRLRLGLGPRSPWAAAGGWCWRPAPRSAATRVPVRRSQTTRDCPCTPALPALG
jgi:hypothetical protein